MSNLTVGSISGLGTNNNVVTVPTGHTIKQPGSVLQVVQTVKTDATAMSSGAVWADIPGMSATITPKFSTSKILVMVDVKIAGTVDSSTVRAKLIRNATDIYVGDAASSRPRVMGAFYINNAGAGIYYMAQCGGNYLDSPATTSATTYKVQIGGDGNSTVAYINRTQGDRDNAYYDGRGVSSITLMEIAQ
jgi:hypothetical protein